jgi:hypothetical protein
VTHDAVSYKKEPHEWEKTPCPHNPPHRARNA